MYLFKTNYTKLRGKFVGLSCHLILSKIKDISENEQDIAYAQSALKDRSLLLVKTQD